MPVQVESLGDYYAAARISGAPVPPPEVLARAVTIQVRKADADAASNPGKYPHPHSVHANLRSGRHGY